MPFTEEDHQECEHKDERFLQITVEYGPIGDSADEAPVLGSVGMHMHNLPPQVLVDTLVTVALEVIKSGMNVQEVLNTESDLPPEITQAVLDTVARKFLSGRIERGGGRLEAIGIPEDISELLE